MVKKKTKPLKRGRKRALKEDVHATTSLPPSVDGQLRCFLRVSVSKIVWQTAKPPDTTHIRLKWWGEISEGSIFRPLDVKNPQKVATRTIARYPVRCGPKQFAAYLNDMGTLILEVLKGPSMSCIGKAQINEIGHLAPQVPINGFYSVFSNKSADKIAELHASLVFEPLPSAYDSSSSIPTTDLSVATAGTGTTAESSSIRSGPPLPAPRPWKVMTSSSEDPFMSPIPRVPHHDRHTAMQWAITPRGVDEDYSFVVGPGKMDKPAERKSNQIGSDIETGLQTAVPSHNAVVKAPSSDTDHARTSEVETLLGRNREFAREKISEPAPVRRHHRLDPSSQPGSDLISALLDRGTKLRDNMIRSELDRGATAVKGGTHGRPERRQDGIPVEDVVPRPVRRRSSGELFREILRTDDTPAPVHVGSAPNGLQHSTTESQTVELLIGDQISARELNDLKTLQSELSPQSSVSSESDFISETEDPLRDQSILEELFYKGMRSSSGSSLSDLLSSEDDEIDSMKRRSAKQKKRRWSYESSLSDPGNQRPPSRKDRQQPSTDNTPVKDLPMDLRPSTQNPQVPSSIRHSQMDKTSKKAQQIRRRQSSMSEAATSDSDAGSTSRVSFQEPLVEKEVNPADGLSVQRLTLLGRIHIARVIIDSLTLRIPPGAGTPDRRPSRGGRGRGRPPRPSAKPKTKKCTYFVEYRFPVTASPREQSLVNTMATEVMRLVSKKVDSNGEITFGHRSVFPVCFDGSAVDSWWKQLLVFKIFSRTAGQKSPVLLGVASLPLRAVLQSPDFALLSVDLDARDKTQSDPGSHTGDESPSTSGSAKDAAIGTLKMSIELASDSKDFPTALARMKLAEMRGAKIVALPSNQPHLPIKIPTGSVDSDNKSSSRSVQAESTPTQVAESISGDKKMHPTPARESSEGVQTSSRHNQPQPSQRQAQREEERLREQPSRHVSDERIDVKSREDVATNKQTRYEARTLYSLLLIPEGRAVTLHGVAPLKPGSGVPHTPPQPHPGLGVGLTGIGGRDQTTRNTYLVCRLFWSDDSVRSNVCWGTTEPDYNFMQVSPLLLTPSLLERARNNCMVIEVWDKKTSAQNDQLVGIAKLPLHQFYMSFRDDRIASTLLKSQFPVVAIDNYVNIVDPFTGVQYGQLKVLLALGSSEQVSALQRLKCDKDALDTRPSRPGHYLERGEAVTQNVNEQDPAQDELVEHIFEVVVEGVRGLPQLEDTVWGEADCFVQYHFPSHSPTRGPPDSINTLSVGPVLAPHQTPTTLCMPDPTFHDVSRHRLQLPRGTPVQRELLTACAGVGGGAGGIPFEVWCRYYYPNIRDQVVAKTSLPLAKLCAMVTMQRRGEPSVQTFSLPLRLQHPDQDSLTQEQMAKLQDAGLLDVTINYRHSVVQGGGFIPRSKETGGPQVCLSVGVLRACGLKSAAASLAQFDSSLQYASEVGVNAYIKMELSFLSKQEVRITQTVARTFAPEFSHHVDFPCPLLFDDQDSDQLSLAEALETAEMKLEVWHQVPGFKSDHDVNLINVDSGSNKPAGMSARRLFAPTGDVLLGTATVPLQALLSHRTGLQGWYPLSIPTPGWTNQLDRPSTDSPQGFRRRGLDRVGGGLELSLKFAHQGDRDRVIDAGRRVGWSPEAELEGSEEIWDDEDTSAGSYSADINVNVDSAWFPVHTALRPGQQALDTAAKAYVRYKLYDKGSVCSKLCYLDANDENYITADLKHSHRFHSTLTQPLAWYLREERLEIQLWVSYNRELSLSDTGHTRPRQRDKLIGCAYVDMSALCDKRIKQRRISGLYPLFRPGSSDLGGSCMRVHLSLKHVHSESRPPQESSDKAEMPSRDRHRQIHPSQPHQEAYRLDTEEEAARRQEEERRQREEEEEQEARRELTKPVLMGVAVERAMHLVSVPFSNRLEDGLPSCYVTFQSADVTPVHTPTVPNTAQPVWGFEQEVQISAEVLDRQSFIFKVWHQTMSEPDMNSDRMLGFASVDLAPLLAGFRSLNGWYNILDFGGHCRGQIKVSITPRESVSPLKRSPKPKASPNASAILAQGFPHIPLTTLPASQPPSSQPARPFSPPKSAHPPSNHYQEHLQNVRKFHVDLHDRLRARQPDSTTSKQGRDGRRDTKTTPAVMLGDGSQLSSSISSSFLMQNLRQNLAELDNVYHRLQQKLTEDQPPDHRSHQEKKLTPEQVPNSHPPAEELTNKENVGTSRRQGQYATDDPSEDSTRRTSDKDVLEKIRADLQKEDAEHMPDNDAVGEDDGGWNRYLETEEPPSPQPESDWEDSVQFQDREDRDSEPEEDVVVVPRPLNDISSANFSNGVRPDVFLGAPNHPGGVQDLAGMSHSRQVDRIENEILRQQGIDDEAGRTNFLGDEHELGQVTGLTDQLRTGFDEGSLQTASNGRSEVEGERTPNASLTSAKSDSSENETGGNTDHVNPNRDAITDEFSHQPSDQSSSHSKNHVQSPAPPSSNTSSKDQDNPQRVGFGSDSSAGTRSLPEASEGFDEAQNGIQQGHHGNFRVAAGNTEYQTVGRNGKDLRMEESSMTSDLDPELRSKFRSQQDSSKQTMQEGTKEDRASWSPEDSSDESVVITIDSRQAEKQATAGTRTEQPSNVKHSSTQSPPAQLPNFFLPTQDLEASMRALHNVTSVLPRAQPRQVEPSKEAQSRPTDAAKELTQRLASHHSSARPRASRPPPKPAYKLPTAEEAIRIAKIFASRFSDS